MKFEDTGLPDHEAIRIAFKRAEIEAAVNNMGQLANAGGRKQRPLELFVRAGKVLHETYPAAHPEQIAAAILFLSHGFQEPAALICRAHKSDLPQVCTWAQEWSEINNLSNGEAPLKGASLELRQIITAVNIAMIENFKNNLSALSVHDVRENLAEKDLIAKEVGDLKVPALEDMFRQVRGEIAPLIKREPIVTTFLRRLGL